MTPTVRLILASSFVGVLLLSQIIRIVITERTDPVAALRSIGIGVGLVAIAVLALGAFVYARSIDARARRASLGDDWLDNVMVYADDDSGIGPRVNNRRDFAIGVKGGKLRVWAQAGEGPLLTLSGSEITSVETTAVDTAYESERSVIVGTRTGTWTFTPSTHFGLPPTRRRFERLVSSIQSIATTDLGSSNQPS